jgi:tetratricopeptide (TPR) repeat protein
VPLGVGDLAGSDAVELFAHRARSAQPAFALNDGNAAAVAQICHRLDGIPLALELAASRIRVLGAHQLAERLDDRFRVLAGTARGGPSRHQTLQATIDWSWDLLPTREREALRRLSVFPAAFDLDGAEAVIVNTAADPGPVDAAELVLRLVDKSLVVAAGEGPVMRYRLLETVRSYAAARLSEAGEEEQARDAHCEHLLRLADESAADGYWMTEERLRRIGCDEAGFVAALDWSVGRGRRTDALRLMAGHWPYLLFYDRIDMAPLLDRCLADPLPPPSPALVECLSASWLSWPERGGGAVDDDLLVTLRTTAEKLGDEDVVARTRFFIGHSLAQRGRVEEARTVLLAAHEHFTRRGWRIASGWFEPPLGWIHTLGGDLDGAAQWFERAAAVEDGLVAAQALCGLATVAALAGHNEAARDHLDRALGAARDILPLRRFLLMALCRATEIGLVTGDEPMAADALDELLVTLRELGILRWVAGALEATVLLLPCECAEEAALLSRLLAAAERVRLMLREETRLPIITERLAAREREITALLGGERLTHEAERGRRASADEALRWALTALRESRPARK